MRSRSCYSNQHCLFGLDFGKQRLLSLPPLLDLGIFIVGIKSDLFIIRLWF
jgi:hypothetical protein